MIRSLRIHFHRSLIIEIHRTRSDCNSRPALPRCAATCWSWARACRPWKRRSTPSASSSMPSRRCGSRRSHGAPQRCGPGISLGANALWRVFRVSLTMPVLPRSRGTYRLPRFRDAPSGSAATTPLGGIAAAEPGVGAWATPATKRPTRPTRPSTPSTRRLTVSEMLGDGTGRKLDIAYDVNVVNCLDFLFFSVFL